MRAARLANKGLLLLLILSSAVLITVATARVVSAGGATPAPNDSTIAAQVAKPLSANRRLERERYLARRLGLGFGVPPQARATAVTRMQQMKADESMSVKASTPSSPATGAGR